MNKKLLQQWHTQLKTNTSFPKKSTKHKMNSLPSLYSLLKSVFLEIRVAFHFLYLMTTYRSTDIWCLLQSTLFSVNLGPSIDYCSPQLQCSSTSHVITKLKTHTAKQFPTISFFLFSALAQHRKINFQETSGKAFKKLIFNNHHETVNFLAHQIFSFFK